MSGNPPFGVPPEVEQARQRNNAVAIQLFEQVRTNLAIQNETNTQLIGAIQNLADKTEEMDETMSSLLDAIERADVLLDMMMQNIQEEPSCDLKTIFAKSAKQAVREVARRMKERENEDDED